MVVVHRSPELYNNFRSPAALHGMADYVVGRSMYETNQLPAGWILATEVHAFTHWLAHCLAYCTTLPDSPTGSPLPTVSRLLSRPCCLTLVDSRLLSRPRCLTLVDSRLLSRRC